MSSKIGKIRISNLLYVEGKVMLYFYECGFLPYSIDMIDNYDEWVFTGWCESFKPVRSGQNIPEYVMTISYDQVTLALRSGG